MIPCCCSHYDGCFPEDETPNQTEPEKPAIYGVFQELISFWSLEQKTRISRLRVSLAHRRI